MLLSSHLKKKLNFLKEDTFVRRKVGVTCQTCAVQNCKERVAEPVRIIKNNKYQEISNTVDKIINSYN